MHIFIYTYICMHLLIYLQYLVMEYHFEKKLIATLGLELATLLSVNSLAIH